MVTTHWVINASPLIVLDKIGYLHLIDQLADVIYVPQAVIREIEVRPIGDQLQYLLQSTASEDINLPIPEGLLAWDLGSGETAVIAFAIAHPSYTVVIDDAAARRCAQAHQLNILGTIGIIVLAKRHGLSHRPNHCLKIHRLWGYIFNRLSFNAQSVTLENSYLVYIP